MKPRTSPTHRGMPATLWATVLTALLAAPAADAASTTHLVNAQTFVSQLRSQGEAGLFFDATGIGYVYVHTLNGSVTAYSWKQYSGSTVYVPAVRHLTIGRPTS